MGILRKINEKYLKKYSSRKSIEGSIYGDMQRKRKSQWIINGIAYDKKEVS